MAAVTSRAAALARGALDDVLRVHAHVLFSRSRVVGALLVVAVLTDPTAAAMAGVGLAAAALCSKLLGLAPEGFREGAYGYNALLVALGVAHYFGVSGDAFALAAAASAASVVITAALSSLAARLGGVPVLSVPFVIVLWVTQVFAASRGVFPLAPLAPSAFDVSPVASVLSGFGALLFAPRPEAGALVLAALLVHSRIAALLVTFAIAAVVPFAPDVIAQPVALNAALTAVVLGGVWFVPSASSFAIGTAGAALAAAITVALAPPLAGLGLAPLILPFALASIVVLLATRQRVSDARPKSVDFVPGSPEENLAYFQTRRARFRALHAVPIHLPFRGAWLCTQGESGKLTHRAQWRHAFDFEGTDGEGRTFRGDGASLDDHHCYRLPVLAAADGVVAKVENDVADNAIGGLDLERNWGNVVLVYHAPGLYSLVAHLARGSVRVREGQPVRRGDVLGACGNSGRSPRPHLHFQLQATPQLGAATVPCRFTDLVVRGAAASRVTASGIPREGEVVRDVEPDADVAACLTFLPGTTIALRVRGEGAIEHLESDVDLLGHRLLRSRERGAALYFAQTEDGLTAYDVLGSPRSALHLVRAALGRAPFEGGELRWRDYLPARWTGWRLLRPLRDLVAPFVPGAGLAIEYRARREGGQLVVTGASLRQRRGVPIVRTVATLSRARGLEALEVHAGGRTLRADRVDALPIERDDGASDAPPTSSATPATSDTPASALFAAPAGTTFDAHVRAGETP